jgi:hypothetical protein
MGSGRAGALRRVRSALVGSGAGEERGEVAGRFGGGSGEPGRERQLVDVGVRREVRELGEQRGVGEQLRRQQTGGGRAGGGVRVVPAVRGQGVGEPGVDAFCTYEPARRVSSFRTASSPSRGSVCSSVPSSRSAWSSSARAAIRAASRSSASRARRRPRRRRRVRPGRRRRSRGRRRCPARCRRAAGRCVPTPRAPPGRVRRRPGARAARPATRRTGLPRGPA